MAVILTSPWAGNPPGARLTLSVYDERALVRGGAAIVALDDVHTDKPSEAPVIKPARRGRPRKLRE